MSFYRLADFTVEITPLFPLLTEFCKEYAIPPVAVPDFSLSVTAEEIRNYRSLHRLVEEKDDYIELLLIYQKLCRRLPAHGAFFMHAAVLEVDGRGYAFTAKSGTGKSTHLALWRKVYGSRVEVVNGDKPLLRVEGNRVYAYGTPWCGKENWQKNCRVPLEGLCFLTRGEENKIACLTPAEALPRIFASLLPPETREEGVSLLSLCDALLQNVPTYLLSCTISPEAARVAYEAMTKGNPK